MSTQLRERVLMATRDAEISTAAQALLFLQWEAAGVLPRELRHDAYTWYKRQFARVNKLCPLDPEPLYVAEDLDHVLSVLEQEDPLQVRGDVLGPAHERFEQTYVKQAKGCFNTPPDIGAILLDLAGFDGEAVLDGDAVLDCSCGVGALLAEAAARTVRAAEARPQPDPLHALEALLTHIVGVEQDSTYAMIARVHVLLQLGPLLARNTVTPGQLRELLRVSPPAVHHGDGLACFAGDPDDPFPGRQFRWCVGNPPYIRESYHKELFRQARKERLVGQTFYHKDMDVLYWFLICGVSRLAPGGRLAYLTTAYWTENDAATFLRRYLTEQADVERLVLLGDERLFARAPGQHSLLIQLCRKDPATAGEPAPLPRITQLRPPARDADTLPAPLRLRIWSAMQQEDYPAVRPLEARPWPLRITPAIGDWIEQLEAHSRPLESLVRICQGVQTGANSLTSRLSKDLWSAGRGDDVQVGDGIFLLSGEELERLQLQPREREEYVLPLCKARELGRWRAVVPDRYVLCLRDDDDLRRCPRLVLHLERFRPILERRKEFNPDEYGERARPWYALKRARERQLFHQLKLLTPQYATEPLFALSDQPLAISTDARMLVPRRHDVDLYALLAVLNSGVLRLWFEHCLKRKGKILEFYGKAFARTPIPHELPGALGKLAADVRHRGESEVTLHKIDRLVADLYGVPFRQRLHR